MPLANQFWGDRYGQVSDPFGHSWALGQHVEDVAPEEMERRAKEMFAQMAKKTATEQDAAEKQAAALNGVELMFTRKTGENDQMFGSVTSGDIAEALAAQGFKVEKRQIQLGEPIKAIGEKDITVKVFRDITAAIKVTVDKEA